MVKFSTSNTRTNKLQQLTGGLMYQMLKHHDYTNSPQRSTSNE